jgi:predicted phage tail component-like protein
VHSLSFNGVDLAEYGLVIMRHNILLTQQADPTQLQDLARASDSYRLPRELNIEIAVRARPCFPPLPITPSESLKIQLDTIRHVFNQRDDCPIIFDKWPDRYWLARFVSFVDIEWLLALYMGYITLTCNDPAAYGVVERVEDFAINEDPKSIPVSVAFGNDYISPVWTLTAGEELIDATIKIQNIDTGEEITWVGTIDNGEELTIDVSKWLVELEGVAAMGGASGKFPRLLPSQLNNVLVTGFGSLGSLEVTYRERFL